jgi:hypothetical protein
MMANIYVEAKGPRGVQAKESLLPAAVTGYSRGLAVTYTGTDAAGVNGATLAVTPGMVCVGILEEDAISTSNPNAVVEFGQCIAQIGANVTALNPLAVNASGQLVPAVSGNAVVAVALESQTYVSPGSFANVFVLGLFGFLCSSTATSFVATPTVTHITSAGAIPLTSGTYGLGSAGALAMTLATPSGGQDGVILFITAETSHGHTITAAGNKINGTSHIVTLALEGDGVFLQAVGGIWNLISLVGSATLDNYAELTEVTHEVTSTAIPVVSGIYGLGSAGALAMTLATPTAAQDGTELYIVAETAHAHTVHASAGIIIGATTGYATFAAVGDGIQFVAVGCKWMVKGLTGPTPVILS